MPEQPMPPRHEHQWSNDDGSRYCLVCGESEQVIKLRADNARLREALREAEQRQRLAEQALGIEMRGRTALVQSIHDAHQVTQPWLTSQEMIELVAAWDHAAWAGWTAWMLDRLTPDNIARWRRQIVTSYGSLSKAEKESDRKEAREILAIIMTALDSSTCGLRAAVTGEGGE